MKEGTILYLRFANPLTGVERSFWNNRESVTHNNVRRGCMWVKIL